MTAGWRLVVPVLVLAVVSALRRRLMVVRVTGHSMEPTFADGDRLLVRRQRRAPGRHDVVVFRTPSAASKDLRHLDLLVKRVVAVAGEPVPTDLRPRVNDRVVPPGHLLVRGDNPESFDSRQFGYVRYGNLVGTRIRGSAAPRPRRPQRG